MLGHYQQKCWGWMSWGTSWLEIRMEQYFYSQTVFQWASNYNNPTADIISFKCNLFLPGFSFLQIAHFALNNNQSLSYITGIKQQSITLISLALNNNPSLSYITGIKQKSITLSYITGIKQQSITLSYITGDKQQSITLLYHCNNGCLLTFTSSDWLLNILDCIGGVMVCVLVSSVVGFVFEPWSGQTRLYFKHILLSYKTR